MLTGVALPVARFADYYKIKPAELQRAQGPMLCTPAVVSSIQPAVPRVHNGKPPGVEEGKPNSHCKQGSGVFRMAV